MSNGVTRKSLQKKVSLTLLGVMALSAALIYVTMHRIVSPAFDQLELSNARTNLIRAERAILNDLQNLSAVTGDWALWDDAFDFVRGQNPAFRNSNLDRPTLTNLGLNLLAIYNADDHLVWGQVDFENTAHSPASLQILDDGTETAQLLLMHTDPAGKIDGLVRTALGPMMISSWPVVRSDGSGPISGTMIMGQFLDETKADVLRQRTEVSLAWSTVTPGTGFADELQTPLNSHRDGSMHHTTNETTVVSSGLLADLFGVPLLRLTVTTPRNISALGAGTVNSALMFLALAAVVVVLAIWFVLRRIIVSPLEGLARHITAMRKSGDLKHKLDDSRDDEIGELAGEFDKLTDELYDARRQLLDQSFKAGKADNAAEVLHNIRNAMTPLINGIDRLSKNFNVTKKLHITQAIEELSNPDCPPARAGKLFQYIESAFAHIEESNAGAASSLEIAARQARQVEAILADQERHTQVAPVIENLGLDEVLDEAVLVLPTDDSAVELNFEGDVRHYSVHAHRVSLLQVMSNLILNAYESIERSNAKQRRIQLAAREEDVGDTKMIRLTVSDTGSGFDVATQEKIFQRGFSSKDGNLSGLGLHWCANALAVMGGRIQAESAGPGHGAEFHVLLPTARGGVT